MGTMYRAEATRRTDAPAEMTRVSVVIPARNEEQRIGMVIRAVLAQRAAGRDVDVLVVDDGSSDGTAAVARSAGARVIRLHGESGNPAAARNQGAAACSGDPIVFLDADCVPATGWLEALLVAHARGAAVVGGSLELPPGLTITARCDYYCGWYLVHPRRSAGVVPHHPPPNLSVRRHTFLSTVGFTEAEPFSYTNEERAWQGELRLRGERIYFEPRAIAYHYNRPGVRNLLRRHYRWAYTGVAAKSRTGAARAAWIYRFPWLPVIAAAPFALLHTGFIIACWLRAGVLEPVLMTPLVLASRCAYAAGMAIGGVHWLRTGRRTAPHYARAWIET